jgi:hypothetical protein
LNFRFPSTTFRLSLFIEGLIDKTTVIDKHNLMARFALQFKDVFHNAQQLGIGHLGPQFLSDFASDGILAGLAKVKAATQRVGRRPNL